MNTRELSDIPVEELVAARVWFYSAEEESTTEACLVPADAIPVASLRSGIAVLPVRLASGSLITGVLGNFDHLDGNKNKHFLTLSVFLPDGKLFHLARYFDRDLDRCGPEALARELGLALEDVFPIYYDLSELVSAEGGSLSGEVLAHPAVRLSREELYRLTFL